MKNDRSDYGYHQALRKKSPVAALIESSRDHLKNQPPKKLVTAGAAGAVTGLAVAVCIVLFANPTKPS